MSDPTSPATEPGADTVAPPVDPIGIPRPVPDEIDPDEDEPDEDDLDEDEPVGIPPGAPSGIPAPDMPGVV